MKLFITGGAGFIGSHVVLDAIEKGYEVVNLDALTYAANLENLKSIGNHVFKSPLSKGDLGGFSTKEISFPDKNYKFIKGDIRDKDLLKKLFEDEKFDAIIHLAAETHVDFSITNPSIFIETNIVGTQNLLELALENKVKKFVHVSTDEVYGSLQKNENAFTETSILKPNSPYSASKAASDLLVRSYHKTFGLNTCITRCSNNYGPHQDASKLLPKVISNALNNQKIPIYGKGENIRDWLFVKDHTDAILTVLEKGVSGEIYNIGGNNEQSNLVIVRKILALLNKPESLIEFVSDRPGHDFRYAIDATKIKNELGWKQSQDFEKNLEETIRYFR